MKNIIDRLNQFIVSCLKSERFIWFIITGFIFESLWVAFSGVYPMAFDEDFHFGIIRIYSHHLSPFFSHQPANANSFGAVARDPSYLFHYLMSFPYRLISLTTSSFYARIMFLRILDIILLAIGIWLFNRLLTTTRTAAPWRNLVLLFFILIPVLPQLAAQINYDNLFIPLVALCLLETINIVNLLESTRKISLPRLLLLAILCLLSSLVKYAFLPIFLVIVVYLIWKTINSVRSSQTGIWPWLIPLIRETNKFTLIVALAGVIISGGLFFERYGINLIRYHAPIPACDQVLSIPECSSYGPWERDYLLKQNKATVNPNQIKYTGDWVYGLFERSFFAVNGPQSNFATQPALPVLAMTAAVLGSGGVILFIWFRKPILRSTRRLGFLLAVSAVYAGALWEQNYTAYLKVGQPVAINGRYVFPIIIPILLAIALGYRHLLMNHRHIRNYILVLFFAVIITQGGGATTFIIRSDRSWYWPNDRPVITANRFVRKLYDPVVVH